MSKICTDIKQSKRLVELGLDTNTANMFWMRDFPTRDDWESVTTPYKDCEDEDAIPAWSLTALLKLMPEMVPFKKGAVYPLMNIWENSIEYSNAALEKLYITKSNDNPLDAAFEMIIWLLENKIVK